MKTIQPPREILETHLQLSRNLSPRIRLTNMYENKQYVDYPLEGENYPLWLKQ